METYYDNFANDVNTMNSQNIEFQQNIIDGEIETFFDDLMEFQWYSENDCGTNEKKFADFGVTTFLFHDFISKKYSVKMISVTNL